VCTPSKHVYLPLNHSGNPGVSDGSYRGVNGKPPGQLNHLRSQATSGKAFIKKMDSMDAMQEEGEEGGAAVQTPPVRERASERAFPCQTYPGVCTTYLVGRRW
jgi:hypothetical protein